MPTKKGVCEYGHRKMRLLARGKAAIFARPQGSFHLVSRQIICQHFAIPLSVRHLRIFIRVFATDTAFGTKYAILSVSAKQSVNLIRPRTCLRPGHSTSHSSADDQKRFGQRKHANEAYTDLPAYLWPDRGGIGAREGPQRRKSSRSTNQAWKARVERRP